jgi:hypothetical protein
VKPTTQELIDHYRRKFPMSDLLIRYDAQYARWFVHAMSPGYVAWLENQHLTGGPAHFSCHHQQLNEALMTCITEYTKRIRL